MKNYVIFSLKNLGFFFVFTEEIAFKHSLFINITKSGLFLFFSDGKDIKKQKLKKFVLSFKHFCSLLKICCFTGESS